MNIRHSEIGEVVCDMHYGLPPTIKLHDVAYETGELVVVECAGSMVLEALLDAVGILDVVGIDRVYTNKMAVVVGKSRTGLVAAYSYDDRRFGMFNLRRRSDGS